MDAQESTPRAIWTVQGKIQIHFRTCQHSIWHVYLADWSYVRIRHHREAADILEAVTFCWPKAVTLMYLAPGDSYKSLIHSFRVPICHQQISSRCLPTIGERPRLSLGKRNCSGQGGMSHMSLVSLMGNMSASDVQTMMLSFTSRMNPLALLILTHCQESQKICCTSL